MSNDGPELRSPASACQRVAELETALEQARREADREQQAARERHSLARIEWANRTMASYPEQRKTLLAAEVDAREQLRRAVSDWGLAEAFLHWIEARAQRSASEWDRYEAMSWRGTPVGDPARFLPRSFLEDFGQLVDEIALQRWRAVEEARLERRGAAIREIEDELATASIVLKEGSNDGPNGGEYAADENDERPHPPGVVGRDGDDPSVAEIAAEQANESVAARPSGEEPLTKPVYRRQVIAVE